MNESRNEAHPIQFNRNICSDLNESEQREWLVTNGIGGYAMGTVSGLRTRSYHGLLVAALDPPLGRTLLLSNLEESMTLNDLTYELYALCPQDSDVSPKGYLHIESFWLDGTTPTWIYAINGTQLKKQVWMKPGENTIHIRYTLLQSKSTVKLDIKTVVNYRDHHSRSSTDLALQCDQVQHGVRISPLSGRPPFYVLSTHAFVIDEQKTQERLHLNTEAARGLMSDDIDIIIGSIHASLQPGDTVHIVSSTNEVTELDGALAHKQRERYEAKLINQSPEVMHTDTRIRQLVLAADQFIVKRTLTDTTDGYSILAGYPWFGDWGRDTMISLPGLLIETGRPEFAAKVLHTFAQYVDQGMLPNRFPDSNDTPEYNTVDATLWFFQAVRVYFEHTGDKKLLEELYPVLEDIINWHIRGTRHHIHVDPSDQLLYAGEPGTQLTWMDAKYNDWVVTPRIGKPVEINALWYNALHAMADFARVLRHANRAYRYESQAEQVAHSFGRFWNDATGYCNDVIDGPNGDETFLRPNQIFVVSLPHSPLSTAKQEAIVRSCEQSLLTPYGLRSLAPFEPGYTGRYEGDTNHRDGSYHQGTVWAWLIGPFVEAHLRVFGDTERAASYLEPLIHEHLSNFGLGSVSEIFDGDDPFTGRGCPEQAWSVAELLRVWLLVQSK